MSIGNQTLKYQITDTILQLTFVVGMKTTKLFTDCITDCNGRFIGRKWQAQVFKFLTQGKVKQPGNLLSLKTDEA